MTQTPGWPAELTRTTARQIRALREHARLSAQQLADRMADEIGGSYTRTQVTNLESGRRETITVGEVLAFARILGVAPLMLVFPLGSPDAVEVLPGTSTDTWTAWQWATGDIAGDDVVGELQGRIVQPNQIVNTYRRHQQGLAVLAYAGSDSDERVLDAAASRLAAARIEMHRAGWALPAIPASVHERVRRPMAGWGYVEDPPGTIRAAAVDTSLGFTDDGDVLT
ncbi:helix-turn-helix domain-containing protein [Pseudonocardia sp. CA-107938]|uniref:helix-turn-helix domain-containing protein n=1 Tax=Pseudonocardia sp. CA-107938 TaxID=3240021 RepID=UPI003D8F5C81